MEDKPQHQARRGRRPGRRAVLLGGVTALAAAGGGSAWALDRFVIDHAEVTDVAALEAEQGVSDASEADSSGTTTSTDYESDTAAVSLSSDSSGSGDDTITWYVADVQLDDPTRLRSAFAQNEFGTNIVEYTSDIAADNNAVFAINGDYYGFRDTGIEIRNGIAYRDAGARQGLAMYEDGTCQVYDETATSADELVAAGVWNTLSFGPALIVDGAIQDGIDDVEVDTNVGNHSIQGDQPRTVVGWIDTGHYVLVAIDGRSSGYSKGATMTEAAQIMADLGCQIAYNIDGGGSTTMVFNDQLVNNPLGKGKERGTSDILYIGR